MDTQGDPDAWLDAVGRVRQRWPALSLGDVLIAEGSAEYLAEMLQDRCGIDRQQALRRLRDFSIDI